MNAAELLTAKAGYGFDFLDADGDGRLDERDHVLMGERAARALGQPPGSHGEERLIEMYLRIWRDLHVPNLPAGESAIPRDRFVEGVVRASLDDPSAARAALAGAAETFLDIVDLDADGRISPEEFRTFLRGHFPDISDSDSAAAFSRLDTDGDGSLSPEEFVGATVDYWTSGDPASPGNWWAGPQPGVTH